ncbi:response regulator transcription factor [Pseudomonas fluorescens]|nr:response regulator [Pseudomonas fluorescens]
MSSKISVSCKLVEDSIVLVVDDDDVVRRALSSLLRSVGYSVEEFAHPSEMLVHPSARVAGCMILDVRLQGCSGFDVQAQMSESGILMPIIFMTGHGDIPMSVKAMKAGAVDFFSKPFNQQDLLDSVAGALATYRRDFKRLKDLRDLRERFDSLTPREKQVMHGVTQGLLNKQIAGDLRISEVTVKLHRANTMRKMSAATNADLIRAGQELSLT